MSSSGRGGRCGVANVPTVRLHVAAARVVVLVVTEAVAAAARVNCPTHQAPACQHPAISPQTIS